MIEPELFGKYILLERIAVGGMGEILLAKGGREGYQRYFAIKRIIAHQDGSTELVQQLMQEAKLALGLVHPNIAQIFELGELRGTFFLVMEYVEGLSLAGLLSRSLGAREPMAPGDAVSIAVQICRALEYAHNKADTDGSRLGIIHRDVSPQNVLIDHSGLVKLIDFGIAKAATAAHKTEVGLIKGKVAYMAPEQARGEPLDKRADLFSAGVLLYEMLTYERFYADTEPMAMLVAAQKCQHAPVSIDAGVPESVVPVLETALAPKRDDRYKSAAVMERALAEALADLDPSYTPHRLSEFVQKLDSDKEDRAARFRTYTDISASSLATRNVSVPPPSPSQAPTENIATPGGKTIHLVDEVKEPRRKPWLLPMVAVLTVGIVTAGAWAAWRSMQPTDVIEPRDPRPAVDAPAVRSIIVKTEPAGAEVMIDDQPRGTTPLIVEDVPTDRAVHIRVAKKGYEPVERTLEPGDAAAVELTLRRTAGKKTPRPDKGKKSVRVSTGGPPVCVMVVVEPWAHVKVGGKKVGTTPIPCLELPPGKHKLTLTNPVLGATKTVTVVIKAGKENKVFENLTP